jgi:hypothetical protein
MDCYVHLLVYLLLLQLRFLLRLLQLLVHVGEIRFFLCKLLLCNAELCALLVELLRDVLQLLLRLLCLLLLVLQLLLRLLCLLLRLLCLLLRLLCLLLRLLCLLLLELQLLLRLFEFLIELLLLLLLQMLHSQRASQKAHTCTSSRHKQNAHYHIRRLLACPVNGSFVAGNLEKLIGQSSFLQTQLCLQLLDCCVLLIGECLQIAHDGCHCDFGWGKRVCSGARSCTCNDESVPACVHARVS